MKKFIIKGLIFLGIAFVVQLPFIYKYHQVTTTNGPHVIISNYEQQPNLFMGSSHGRDAVNDSLIDASYNMSSTAQSLEENYIILSNILETTKLKKVFISFSPTSLHQTNIKPNLTEQYYLFPHNSKNIFLTYFKDTSRKAKSLIKIKLSSKITTPEEFKDYAEHKIYHVIGNDVNHFGVEFFDKIIALKNQYDFELSFFTTPYTPEYSEVMRTYDYWENDKQLIKEMAIERGFNYYDYEFHFNNEPDYYKYYIDADHLNALGQNSFSSFLNKTLFSN